MERITYLNRYRVIANESGALVELRRSGSAVTYKAQDVQSGAEAAVEVIPGSGLRAAVREELEREALAAKQLNHINIPTLHAFATESDQLIYASEYFDGTSAEEWITKHGPMPVGPVLRIGLQVVNALGAAAFQGIVHHALNPRNIILVPGQTPQGDWPLVKILNLVGVAPTFTGAQAAVATDFGAKFASPEQLERGTVDFQSEMYSLGATLWFLLTGAAPERGIALSRASGVPKPVMQMLGQMLSLTPGDRPRDPLAFEEYIRECIAQVEKGGASDFKLGAPVPAAVPVIERKPERPIPWKPLAIAAIALALAVLVALILPKGFRPGQLFAGSGEAEPIGVPIGVPDATAPIPEPAAETTSPATAPVAAPLLTNAPPPPAPPVATPDLQTAPPVIASNPTASAPSTAEPVSNRDASQAPSADQSVTAANPRDASVLQTEATSSPATEARAATPQLVSRGETPAGDLPEPAPPSEGPDETSAPPSYAASAPEPADQRPTAKPDTVVASDSRSEELPPAQILPRMDRPLAAEPVNPTPRVAKKTKRPKRINGREVRPAAPVETEVWQAGLPKRSKRARFLGTAPDGSLVFELPSSERGFVAPRR